MKSLFICTLLLLFTIPFASAHTTVNVGSYQFEAGWDIEPPIVDFSNRIVLEVTQRPSPSIFEPVTNAFTDLEATIKFGGISKTLDVNTDSNPGHYSSKIIPTKTGSYIISLSGMVDNTSIDIEIPIEDVETSDSLDFPLRQSSSSNELTVIQGTLNLLEQDIQELQSGDMINNETTYDIAILGASMGIIGLIIGVIAIIKKR